MKDRAGFLAACADAMTELCAFYLLVGVVILSERGWGLHLGWILLCTAACSLVSALFLQKSRSMAAMTAAVTVMFAAVLTVYLLVSKTPLKFGYVSFLVLGAGFSVGCSLGHALNRPRMLDHLTKLDVLVLVMAGLLLCRKALGIDHGVVACMSLVLVLDGAAAVGLRMTEGAADTEYAFKASMIAFAGVGGLAVLVALLVMVFSRGAAVASAAAQVVKAALLALWQAIERFMEWLAGLVDTGYTAEPAAMSGEFVIPEVDQYAALPKIPVDPRIFVVLLGLLILVAFGYVVWYFRKKRLNRGTKTMASSSNTAVRRRKASGRNGLWSRIWAAVRFRWISFLRRDTPGGVLVWLERRAKRCRCPRRPGESMGSFLRRMDPSGGLETLSGALDREYYGNQRDIMSGRDCRRTRQYIRKVVQHD